ncbi:hypothetical protein MRX96_000627 [Rhipicephalus microplus]
MRRNESVCYRRRLFGSSAGGRSSPADEVVSPKVAHARNSDGSHSLFAAGSRAAAPSRRVGNSSSVFAVSDVCDVRRCGLSQLVALFRAPFCAEC